MLQNIHAGIGPVELDPTVPESLDTTKTVPEIPLETNSRGFSIDNLTAFQSNVPSAFEPPDFTQVPNLIRNPIVNTRRAWPDQVAICIPSGNNQFGVRGSAKCGVCRSRRKRVKRKLKPFADSF